MNPTDYSDNELTFWKRIHRANLGNELFRLIREVRLIHDEEAKTQKLSDDASDVVFLIDILLCNDIISLESVKKAMRFFTDPSSDLTVSVDDLKKKVIDA